MSILEVLRRGPERLALPHVCILPQECWVDPPKWMHLKAGNALPVSAERMAAKDALHADRAGVAQSWWK